MAKRNGTAAVLDRQNVDAAPSRPASAVLEGLEIMTFRLKGITPLLQNNPMTQIGVSDGVVSRRKKYDDTEEAEKRLYVMDDGSFGHPTVAAKQAAICGGKGHKIKGAMTASGVLRQNVFVIVGDELSMIENSKGKPLSNYTHHKCTVVVQKARIMRVRPQFDDWYMSVSMEVDTEQVDRNFVEQFLRIAGRKVGIGDYRPEKGGSYGRFEVL